MPRSQPQLTSECCSSSSGRRQSSRTAAKVCRLAGLASAVVTSGWVARGGDKTSLAKTALCVCAFMHGWLRPQTKLEDMRAELGTPLLKQLSQREQVELQRLNKEVTLLREQAACVVGA